MGIKLIITGSTGMVGEGVLLECLQHPEISEILMVNRRHNEFSHSKLKECIAPDFLALEEVTDQFSGYNACLYCAGISSSGMNEAEYTRITYDTAMHFARTLAELNPGMIFIHVSGAMTDSSEAGKMMWARVKGKTENALMRLPFKMVYNFRPGFMKATAGQKNVKSYYGLVSWMYPFLRIFLPNYVSTLSEVGRAMIKCILEGYPKQILEIKDINLLAKKGL